MSKAAGSLEKPQQRKRRIWLFRMMAILFGLCLLMALEGALRLLNIGVDTSLVIPTSTAMKSDAPSYSHQFNGAADLVYYGPTDLSGPEIRPFNLPKPENTLRIIVLGESTVMGFPYASELSFPRHVEMQLLYQQPERPVEVLNAGITGINSFALADLAEQCLEASPDLIVLHIGHNEFYGTGGPGSSAFNFHPSIIRAAFAVRHLRTIQLLAGGYGKAIMQDDLFNTLPRQLDIPLSSSIYVQAKQNFETNLKRIVATCSQAKVPLLLAPVACNLRDQSPMMAVWPETARTGRTEWKNLMSQAADLMAQNDFKNALTIVEEATTLIPQHAESQYRLGQCLHKLNRQDEAYLAFSRARDLDACRYRMPSEFYSVALSVIADRDQCYYFDIQQGFKTAGFLSAPGNELFTEHVHYNFNGHYVLGKLIAEAIQTQCLSQPWDAGKVPDLQQASDFLGFLTEDDLAAASFVIQMLETGPFLKCVDRENQLAYLVNRAKELFESMPENRQNAFADLQLPQLSNDILLHLLAAHERNGDEDFCKTIAKCHELRNPWLSTTNSRAVSPKK